LRSDLSEAYEDLLFLQIYCSDVAVSYGYVLEAHRIPTEQTALAVQYHCSEHATIQSKKMKQTVQDFFQGYKFKAIVQQRGD
jgi:hypothetical protein